MISPSVVALLCALISTTWLLPVPGFATPPPPRNDAFAGTPVEGTTVPVGSGGRILSNWAPTAPTIDGVINASEWTHAFAVDIGPDTALVFLYVMNNANTLFLAYDEIPNTTMTASNNDQVSVYIDDEGGSPPNRYDNVWTNTACSSTPNRGEGNWSYGAFGSNPRDLWRAWIAGPATCSLQRGGTNTTAAIGTGSGHRQYEVAIPLNGSSALLASPGQIIGFHTSTYDGETSTTTGKWPSTATFSVPATYGNLILATSTQPAWTWRSEAESGAITPPLRAGTNPNASSCGYLYDTAGWSAGKVEFSVTVPRQANYYVWIRGMGTSYTTNSFFVAIDTGSDVHYEIPQFGDEWTWGWDELALAGQPAQPLLLDAGSHTLRIKVREANSRLDAVFLTNSPTTVASEVTPCGVTPTLTPTPPGGVRRLYAPWIGRQPTPTPTPTPVCPQDPYEPNGTFAQAWGPVPLNQDLMGYFNCASETDRDFYYFNLSSRRRTIITLQNIPAGSDYDLALYNCADPACQVGFSGNPGTIDERIDVTVNAGRYYVRITRSPTSPLTAQPYRLRVITP